MRLPRSLTTPAGGDQGDVVLGARGQRGQQQDRKDEKRHEGEAPLRLPKSGARVDFTEMTVTQQTRNGCRRDESSRLHSLVIIPIV